MIKRFLQGIVIGIANIVPGVSGGTMMVSMGVYDKLIHCITHLFKEFKKSFLFILPIAIGMLVAIGGSSFGLTWLFDNFPFQTTLLFIGLIIGGFPPIWKQIKGKKIQPGYIIACVFFLALVIGLALMAGNEGSDMDMSISFVNILLFFAMGVITSATMVIPGVSGSMVLMLLGFYYPVIAAIKDFLSALAHLDTAGILTGVGILLPFGIGVIVGIFGIAKLIEIVFEKYPLYAYWAIAGLIIASPVAILLMGNFPVINVLTVITGIVALAVGLVISLNLGEK